MIKTEVIILDLETTGLSPRQDKITEIAAIRFVNGTQKETFHSLINPEKKIPKFITHLTGISHELVENAPTIEKILPKLKKFIRNSAIVAHNASFDYNFLKHNFKLYLNHDFCNERICTAKLARRIHNELPSKRLEALSDFYGLKQDIKHRALEDTLITCEIYSKMIFFLDSNNIINEEVLRFQDMPIQKAIKIIKKN